MHVITRGLLSFLMILSLVSCDKAIKPEELPANISLGATYYTQFVIRYEKGIHLTTNFRRGASIPVNTPVKLLNITTKTIEIQMDNPSQKVLVKNAQQHTGDDIYRAFDKLFAKNKVDLSKFNELERTQIDQGTVAIGMRKAAVIVAIGYPPKIETPRLDDDTWVYWNSRFDRFYVHFKDGKVSRIED